MQCMHALHSVVSGRLQSRFNRKSAHSNASFNGADSQKSAFLLQACSTFYLKPGQEQRLRTWQRSNMTSGLAGAHFGSG